jgi:hypothetical protein
MVARPAEGVVAGTLRAVSGVLVGTLAGVAGGAILWPMSWLSYWVFGKPATVGWLVYLVIGAVSARPS